MEDKKRPLISEPCIEHGEKRSLNEGFEPEKGKHPNESPPGKSPG